MKPAVIPRPECSLPRRMKWGQKLSTCVTAFHPHSTRSLIPSIHPPQVLRIHDHCGALSEPPKNPEKIPRHALKTQGVARPAPRPVNTTRNTEERPMPRTGLEVARWMLSVGSSVPLLPLSWILAFSCTPPPHP